MKKTDAANLVVNELKAEAKRYRRGEMQHIRAVNNGKHGEFKPLPKPTRNQLREAFKAQRFDCWRKLFDKRVTLDEAAGMLLGFSQTMTMNAKFVDAHTPKSKDPKEPPPKSRAPSRPVSSDLVTAFTDMRGDIADWHVTSDGKYRAADLIEWAKEKGFVADEVLAAWEAYNKSDESKQTEQPAASAPVMADSASDAPAWTVSKPKRHKGYTAPLHRLLAAAHREGKPRPTARDVVEAWRTKTPDEIALVLPDGFNYYDAKGNTKSTDLEAIRKAIARMTSAHQSR